MKKRRSSDTTQNLGSAKELWVTLFKESVGNIACPDNETLYHYFDMGLSVNDAIAREFGEPTEVQIEQVNAKRKMISIG
jgi:hypothetical protein